MSRFSIHLPNDKAKTITVLAMLVFLVNGIVYGIVTYNAGEPKLRAVSLFGAVISIAALVILLVKTMTGSLVSFRPAIPLFLLSIIWLIAGNYVLAISTLGFALISHFTSGKRMVQFDEDRVLYPSFPQKVISWEEVSNVVLKDDILTIDLKNNKLMQSVIDTVSTGPVDERAFNAYCRQRLDASENRS